MITFIVRDPPISLELRHLFSFPVYICHKNRCVFYRSYLYVSQLLCESATRAVTEGTHTFIIENVESRDEYWPDVDFVIYLLLIRVYRNEIYGITNSSKPRKDSPRI